MKTQFKQMIALCLFGCGIVYARATPIQVLTDTTVTTENYAAYKDSDIEIADGVFLTFAPASGETFEIRGVLSGDGGLKMTGAGDLAVYGDNTFKAEFIVSSGKLHVYGNNALGSTGSVENRTTVNGTGEVYFHGVTTAEWFGVGRDGRPLIAAADTKNYLSGYLSSSNIQGFLSTESGAELHVTGWYVQNTWGYIRGAGKVFLEGHVAVNQFIGLSAGTDVTIGTTIERVTASSPFSVALNGGWGNFLRFSAADVMKNGTLELGCNVSTSARYAYVYLNGYDQECYSLKAFVSGPEINSTKPAQIRSGLLANDVDPGKLPWVFGTYAGFTWTGSDKITLTEASSSKATLGVEGGSMELEAAATWLNATNIVVKDAALKVNSVAFGEQAYLNISDNGTLEIPSGVQLTVNKLFIDGREQPNGVWGASAAEGTEWTDAHFTGGGTVKVLTGAKAEANPAVWDGGGADMLLATKENWVDDPTDLNFSRGNILATFAQAGTAAIVGEESALRGIVFDALGDFSVDGTAALSVLDGGITTLPPASGSRTYSMSVPLFLTENQNWTLTNDTRIVLSGDVSGIGSLAVTFDSAAQLVLNGVTVAVPFTTSQTNPGLRTATNTVNVLSGKTELRNNVFLEKGSELHFTGGCEMISTAGVISLRTDGDGSRIVFSGKSPRFFSWLYNNGENFDSEGIRHDFEVCLDVADCDFCTFGLYIYNNNVVSCGADYALNYSGLVGLTGANRSGTTGTLKLNGHDQGVTGLEATDPEISPNLGTGRVVSGTPALLHVRSDAVTTNFVVFEEFAGIAKEGTNGQGVMTLGAASPTYGSLEVSNGTLAFGDKGSWLNGSNVTVRGTGVLKITHNRVFGRQMSVSLSDTGKIDLAEGVVQCVREAYRQIDGETVRLASGTYGATGSGAQRVDDVLFSGRGLLAVLGTGLTITVR